MSTPLKFGKYLLLERISVGGMAEVFKAKSFGVEGFEKLVAIKRILPNIAQDEGFIEMFIDEAKIAVQLNHANIAQIYDLGAIDKSYFIALEFINGRDLRTIWERHRQRGLLLPIPMSVYIMCRVCEGLDYAHRKRDASGNDLNIVHRDVSPQNVLISYEGEVKIIDFGIAKAANRASRTQAGILKGKFGYMSPEQVRGLGLDRRSDIFSAGILLFEMLTGERLFEAESDFATLEKIRKGEMLPPSAYNPKIPEALERITIRALAKDPADRFEHAYDMQEELQQFLIANKTNFARKDLAGYMKRAFRTDIERSRKQLTELQSQQSADDGGPDATNRGGEEPPKAAVSAQPPRNPPLEVPLERGDAIEAYQPPEMSDEAGSLAEDNRSTAIPPQGVTAPSDASQKRPTAPVLSPVRTRLWIGLLLGGMALALCLVLLHRAGWLGGAAVLHVHTEPEDAEVLLDGQPVGASSPQRIANLAPGKHSLLIRHRHYRDAAQEIVLGPGAEQTVKIALEQNPATLLLTFVPPDAEVFMDGGPIGKGSPVRKEGIAPAVPHMFTLRREGYDPTEETWTFEPGSATQRSVELKERLFDVAVRTMPPGAQVFLDGVRKGRTPLTLRGLTAGSNHALELRHPKENWHTTLRYDESAPEQVIEKVLRGEGRPRKPLGLEPDAKEPGMLRLNSKPLGNVWIDGQDTQSVTPLVNHKLPPGRHQITIRFPDGGEKSSEIIIKSGQTTKLTLER